MRQRRTDLALEAKELWEESARQTARLEGVAAFTETREGFLTETVEILDERGEKALGKPAGTYITLELDGLARRESDAFGRAARALAAKEARKVGDTRPSPLVNRLAFEAYNRKFAPNRTAYDWLSVRTENVDDYLADPLCGGDPTIGLFREMLGGIAYIEKRENLKRMNRNTPVLFLSGQDDPVGDMGKGVRRAYRSFRRAGVRDVEMKLYPGARHEILNEACGETVCADVYRWLEAHLPKG